MNILDEVDQILRQAGYDSVVPNESLTDRLRRIVNDNAEHLSIAIKSTEAYKADRASILATASSHITKDRASTHGNAEDSFGSIARLWTAHFENSRKHIKNYAITATDVAIMMCLFKIARLEANQTHLDNWIDLAGYAGCGGEIACKPTT